MVQSVDCVGQVEVQLKELTVSISRPVYPKKRTECCVAKVGRFGPKGDIK
jgi:hypothetical protein